jgi:hypothetical protein
MVMGWFGTLTFFLDRLDSGTLNFEIDCALELIALWLQLLKDLSESSSSFCDKKLEFISLKFMLKSMA